MPAPFDMVPVFAFISSLRYEDIGSTGATIHEYVYFQTAMMRKYNATIESFELSQTYHVVKKVGTTAN
jgi:hypothetical protein